MRNDQPAIVAIAVASSGLVCVLGGTLLYLLRRRSIRWTIALVGLVAVGSFVAGIIGTARAMFLSDHGFEVVVWVSVVAGLVSVLFALLLGQSVVRWSRSTMEATRAFGESGAFESSARGSSEFDELTAELTRTSLKLNESVDRERQLESSRRALVAWVSQDMRTPLAWLRAMTEALEDGMVEDPARYHAQMRAEVDRMAQMVDDLFGLSRIQAGTLQLSMQEISLGDLVSETLAGAGPVARARGVRLGGNAEDGVVVTGDPTELSRVLTNLVTNAIRHTPADGQVAVRVRSSGRSVEVSVADECGGIPEEDLPRVFDVAWRGTNGRTPTADSGAGLGLALVKGIVEAHRGTVSVDNQKVGCRFQVTLPL